MGLSKVVLGSDYPFDMGLEDPVSFVKQNAELTETEKESILAGNWESLVFI